MSNTQPQIHKREEIFQFVLVIVIAIGFRLWGISWGLPDSLHYFSFHPDETLMVSYSLPELGPFNIFAGKLLPHYYNYGSFPFYENQFLLSIASAYHYLGPVVQHGQFNYQNFAKAILIARLLSAAFGVGTVWATYALARRLFNQQCAMWSAALLAVMPLHVQHSHYATVDIGAAFWQTLSMVYAAKVIGATKWTLKYTIFAAITAALCAATKYSGALVMLSLAAALYYRVRGKSSTSPETIKLALIAAVVFVITFIAACPGCVFDTQKFLADVHFESDRAMHHGEIYFQNTGPGWWYIVARNLDAGMGLPLLVLSLAGLVMAFVQRKEGDLLLGIYVLPTYLLLGAAESRYARYEIALLPILAIFAGRALTQIYAKEIELKRPTHPLTSSVWLIVALFTTESTWNLLLPMTHQDNRERAAVWINSHASRTATIATGSEPWFYTATLNPYFAWYVPGSWKTAFGVQNPSRYCFNPSNSLDLASVDSCNAPVTTISEFQYYDPLRLKDPNAIAYFAELQSKYGAPLIFKSNHPFEGMTEIGGLPTQDLPIDMLYPNPTVLVYAKH